MLGPVLQKKLNHYAQMGWWQNVMAIMSVKIGVINEM